MPSEQEIRQALSSVPYPGFRRDIVSFGIVESITPAGNGETVVRLRLQTNDPAVPEAIFKSARQALDSLPDGASVQLDFDIRNPPQAPAAQGQMPTSQSSVQGVRHIIAVASGKGGVGKSTVSANLAIALHQAGLKTGLADMDLYGPSQALMFGAVEERHNATQDNAIIHIHRHGIHIVSMGFLLDDAAPVIVRGPLATRYSQQLLRQVAWPDLDVLVLDLPPGTGDIQLTIVQNVALTGALIVTTPQEVALIDARKAASMFAKVNVPVLGIVENMSYFLCPNDGNRYAIFGEGGGASEAKRLDVPLLAQIPLEIATRQGGDAGAPIALASPDSSASSQAFHHLAAQLLPSLKAS